MTGLGDCYEASAKFITGPGCGQEWTLVQGQVTGQGPIAGVRHGHAWLERGDQVRDVSNGRRLNLPKALYYAVGQVDPAECRRFSEAEALHQMVETGHWGPWGETP
ncbi:MAG: hypothetical protein DRQ48_00280 [Gammaproteobacteria bacterium]|nr:MAG: hypothetical protein DRQ48_00280 [Gammaproteobacteria bacterium]